MINLLADNQESQFVTDIMLTNYPLLNRHIALFMI